MKGRRWQDGNAELDRKRMPCQRPRSSGLVSIGNLIIAVAVLATCIP